ncbi:MAG: hypothetical protein KBC64_01085 [Simkaniaceae bacterium]|nr:hypothetical protein [Simkaniaceae bacterium]
MRMLLVLCLGFLMGCYQATSNDEYRPVPTTNNPHLIPRQGGNPGLPI